MEATHDPAAEDNIRNDAPEEAFREWFRGRVADGDVNLRGIQDTDGIVATYLRRNHRLVDSMTQQLAEARDSLERNDEAFDPELLAANFQKLEKQEARLEEMRNRVPGQAGEVARARGLVGTLFQCPFDHDDGSVFETPHRSTFSSHMAGEHGCSFRCGTCGQSVCSTISKLLSHMAPHLEDHLKRNDILITEIELLDRFGNLVNRRWFLQ